MRCDEEQGHIDPGVSELVKRVGALGVLLALDMLAVLALDVLQDWLPCLIQCIVACMNRRHLKRQQQQWGHLRVSVTA